MDKQTDRQRGKQTETQTKTERQTDKEANRHRQPLSSFSKCTRKVEDGGVSLRGKLWSLL